MRANALGDDALRHSYRPITFLDLENGDVIAAGAKTAYPVTHQLTPRLNNTNVIGATRFRVALLHNIARISTIFVRGGSVCVRALTWEDDSSSISLQQLTTVRWSLSINTLHKNMPRIFQS